MCLSTSFEFHNESDTEMMYGVLVGWSEYAMKLKRWNEWIKWSRLVLLHLREAIPFGLS